MQALRKLFGDQKSAKREIPQSQKDVNLGATLMYVGTLLSFFISNFLSPFGSEHEIVFWVGAIFLLILISGRLKRLVNKRFSAKPFLSKGGTDSDTIAIPEHHYSLLATEDQQVIESRSGRANTAEMAEPSSVTEQTTKLLD